MGWTAAAAAPVAAPAPASSRLPPGNLTLMLPKTPTDKPADHPTDCSPLHTPVQREKASGDDYLADLPEHCVRETRGERLAVAAGLAAVAVQLVGAYVSLSLTLRLPAKAE